MSSDAPGFQTQKNRKSCAAICTKRGKHTRLIGAEKHTCTNGRSAKLVRQACLLALI